jgi:hypothetical protein
MALKKITDLPLTSSANLTDLFEKTTDPSGSPLTESINLTQIQTLFGNTFSSITSLNNTGANLLNLINTLSGFDTGSFALRANTGNFVTNSQTGVFYLNSNPSGFISSETSFAANSGSYYPRTNPSGYITGVDLSTYTLNANTGSFIVTNQTGQFYTSNNPSGFITGVDLTSYVTTGQTGNFATIQNDGTMYVPSGIQMWDVLLGRPVTLTSSGGLLVIT